MQDSRSEHNAERIVLAFAALACVATTLVVAWPRLAGGVMVEDWISGRIDPVPERWWTAGIGALAGTLAGLAASLLRSVRDRGRALGICCGSVLAATVHAALLARMPGLFDALVFALLVIPIGIAAAALLREIGFFSLVLAGLVVGLPMVLVRKAALCDHEEARLVAGIRTEVLRLGSSRAFLAADRAFDRRQRRALQLSLMPPFLAPAVALHSVEPESANERSLQSTGHAGVRCIAGQIATVEPRVGAQSSWRSLPAHAEMKPDGVPVVRVDQPTGRFTLRVLTPLGDHRQIEVDPTAGLMLLDDVLKLYLAEVAGLPAGTEILVRAEDDAGATSAWIPLAMPPR